jgi:hypothetical protein
MLDAVYGKGSGERLKHEAALYSRKSAARQEEATEEEDDNVKKTPEFTDLRWEKNGKETGDALVDDAVSLCFDVRNINNGERVKVTVWEHDEDNEHDHVADLEGTVENGKIAINWKVVYIEDNDDSTSGKELAEKGYTLPEYHFVAEYGGVVSEQSKTIQIFVHIDALLKNKATGEILPNIKYVILLPDGNKREGSTDANGKILENKLPIGKRKLIIHTKNNEG